MINAGSLIIIALTFALFLTALFFTGFTHDILLEAGVFLVSVKLILMNYKQNKLADELHKDLHEIKELLSNCKGRHL